MQILPHFNYQMILQQTLKYMMVQ